MDFFFSIEGHCMHTLSYLFLQLSVRFSPRNMHDFSLRDLHTFDLVHYVSIFSEDHCSKSWQDKKSKKIYITMLIVFWPNSATSIILWKTYVAIFKPEDFYQNVARRTYVSRKIIWNPFFSIPNWTLCVLLVPPAVLVSMSN